MEVLVDGAGLGEFEKSSVWVIVVRGGKTGFEGGEEVVPGVDEVVTTHPLIPAECSSFHIEGGYSKAVVFWGVVKFEELVYFEDPTDGVLTIKFWNFEFYMWMGW